MRKIKFRAFDKESGRMFFDLTINNIIDGTIEGVKNGEDFGHWLKITDHILMEFTGLKDSKGVEIYEGDIVKHKLPDEPFDEGLEMIGKIEYDEDVVSFRTYNSYYGQEPIHPDVRIEVIGNIHENPELHLEGLRKRR